MDIVTFVEKMCGTTFYIKGATFLNLSNLRRICLGLIGSFGVVSNSFHIVFSAVSGRLWVILNRPDRTQLYQRQPRDDPGRRSFAVVSN